MPAETQSAPQQSAEATVLEQAQLRQQRVTELICLTEKMGKYAESQGMTDEVFAQLLVEDGCRTASSLTPTSI